MADPPGITSTASPPTVNSGGVAFTSDRKTLRRSVVAALNTEPPDVRFSIHVVEQGREEDADDILKLARSMVEHVAPYHRVQQAAPSGVAAIPAGTIQCELCDDGTFTLHGASLSSGSAARSAARHTPMERSGSGRITIPDWDDRIAAVDYRAVNWNVHRFHCNEVSMTYNDLEAVLANENDRFEFKSFAGASSASDVVYFVQDKLVPLLNAIDRGAPHAALVVGATDKGVPVGLALDDEARDGIVAGVEDYFRYKVFPMVPEDSVEISFVDIPAPFQEGDLVTLIEVAATEDGDDRREAIEVVGRGRDPSDSTTLSDRDQAVPTDVLALEESQYAVWVLKTGDGHDSTEEDPLFDGVGRWQRDVRPQTGVALKLFGPKDKVYWRRIEDHEYADDVVETLIDHVNVHKAATTVEYKWAAVRSADADDNLARLYGDMLADGYVRPPRTVVVVGLVVPLGAFWTRGVFADRVDAWRLEKDNNIKPMKLVDFYLRLRDPPLSTATTEVLAMPGANFSILVDPDDRFPALQRLTMFTFDASADDAEEEADRIMAVATHRGFGPENRPVVVAVLPAAGRLDRVVVAALITLLRDGANVVAIAWPGCHDPAHVFANLSPNWNVTDVCDGARVLASLVPTHSPYAIPSPAASSQLRDLEFGTQSSKDLVGYLRGPVNADGVRRAMKLPCGIPVERTSVGRAAATLSNAAGHVGDDVQLMSYWQPAPRAGVTTFLALLEGALQREANVAACFLSSTVCQGEAFNVWREVAVRSVRVPQQDPIVIVLLLDARLSGNDINGLRRQWNAFCTTEEKVSFWPSSTAVVVSATNVFNKRTLTIPAFLSLDEVHLFEAAFLDVALAWDAHTPLSGSTRADAIRSVAARARAAHSADGNRWETHVWNFALALVHATGAYREFVETSVNDLLGERPALTLPDDLDAGALWSCGDILVALSLRCLLAPVPERSFVATSVFVGDAKEAVLNSTLVEFDLQRNRVRLLHVAFAAEVLQLLGATLDRAIATAVAASPSRAERRQLLKDLVAVRGLKSARFSPLFTSIVELQRGVARETNSAYDPRDTVTLIGDFLAPALELLHPTDADIVRAHLQVAKARVLRDGRRWDSAVRAADDALEFAEDLALRLPKLLHRWVPLRLFHSTCAAVRLPDFDQNHSREVEWDGHPVSAHEHLLASLPHDRSAWTVGQQARVWLGYSDMAVYGQGNKDVAEYVRRTVRQWDGPASLEDLRGMSRQDRMALFRGDGGLDLGVGDSATDKGHALGFDPDDDDDDYNNSDVFYGVELLRRAFPL